MNSQINAHYSYHQTTNRNGQYLLDYQTENNLLCLNTHFQKRHSKLWTYTYPNSIKAQLDFLFINKKWKNSALNCEAYNSFEGVSSDHRIVTAEIRLSLRSNKKKTAKSPQYDWSTLKTNAEIQNKYNISVQNHFNILQNLGTTPNQTYNNFVFAHNKAVEAENTVEAENPRQELKLATKLLKHNPTRSIKI